MTKVSDLSRDVAAMLAESAPVVDVAKGGAHMRGKGKTYLPKFSLEDDADYKARVENTSLFNGVKKARDDMVGKVFEKPIVLVDQSGDLFTWCQNVDLEGRDLSNFAVDVFTGAIQRGIEFIMVDAPARDAELTRGQAQAQNLRPYMVRLPLDTVLGWQWETINNAPTLTQFRIMEEVDAPDRDVFSDDTVEQIRVLTLADGLVTVTLWRRGNGRNKEFEIFDEYPTDLDQIQVVPVYTGRAGFMKASSPLADIAEVNLAHWRTQSDKSMCLHKSLAPLLLIKGIDVEGEAVSSSGYAFTSSAEHADLKWAEIRGSGIAAASDELRDLEKQMQWLGLMLIMERSGVSTATGDAIDEGKSTSKLRMWADNLKDALEIALGWMAEMGGIAGANTEVSVHKDFNTLGHLSMSDVRDLYVSGAISRTRYIREAQRRGVLAEDVDPEEEAEAALAEAISDAGTE